MLFTLIEGGAFVLGKTYSGLSYLVYGSEKTQIMNKLDKLEARINQIDHGFGYKWIAIDGMRVIAEAETKELLQLMVEKVLEKEKEQGLSANVHVKLMKVQQEFMED